MKNYIHKNTKRISGLLWQILLIGSFLCTGGQVFGQASMLSYSNNLSTVSGCDDCNVNVSITSVFPYGITFGGTNYTSIYVGSNGYITFGHGNSGYSPQGIQAYTSGPIVAAQYDDLDPRKGGNVYYDQNTGGNYVVASWVAVYPYNSSVGGGNATTGVTFQVVLRKTGSYSSSSPGNFQIEIRYNNIGWWKSGNNSAWPTAGWSAGNQTSYALLPYSGLSTFNQNQSNSNIAQTGVWRWDVTGGVIQSAPTVNQTTAASGITGSSASSGGNVSSDGGQPVTLRGIVYSTSQNPTTSNSTVTSGSGTGSFTATMNNLSPGTTYYVRAFATNSIGTGYGPQISFTTQSISAPTVTTTSVSNITTNSSSSGGNVTATGGATVTARGVAWNTTGSPTISNSKTTDGSGTGVFTSSITGLSPNTTYYVRAYATNSAGTGYGSQVSFITLPTDPTNASANPSTICSGNATQLSVSNAQGTVYWYSGGCGTTYVGTGNPITVYPTSTTTYYARNNNSSGFSSGCTQITVTVNQPASVPTTASAVATGTSAASLSFGGSTGTGTITYYWVVGTSASVTYGNGTAQGSTTGTTATASGLNQSTTYYLRVYAQNSCGSSSYITSSSFRTHSVLSYNAGPNGTLSGTTSQTIANGANGTAVTAIPNPGYNFVNWSDGSTANPRTDTNVTSSATLTASFAPNRLAYVTQPANKKAGEMIPVSVRITDTYGNTMTDATAEITLSIEANPSIGSAGVLNGTATVAALNGVAVFDDIWINKTGNGYTLKATSPSPIVTQPVSSTFNIIPNKAEYFTVEGIVTPHEAGTTTSPTVKVYDLYDNLKTDYTGTIVFSSDNISEKPEKPTELPGSYTFSLSDNGVKTFTNGVNLKQTSYGNNGNNFIVAVNDMDVPGVTGQQTNIEVTPAPINYFTLVANGTVVAGVPFTVTTTVYDEFGNIKTNYNGPNDVMWTTNASPSPLGNPREIPADGPQDFTSGIAMISGFVFYNAQETPTISITDGPTASPGITDPIVVQPKPLDNFHVEPVMPQTHNIGGVRKTSGEAFAVKVTARDEYLNIQRNYIGNIRFKASEDDLVDYPDGLQAFASADQGIREFEGIKIETAGSYWLRVGDSPDAFKVGDLQNIIVAPGAYNSLESELMADYTSPVTAGDYVMVTVTPRDAGGNLMCDCQMVEVLLNGENSDWDGPILVSDNHDGTYTAMVRVTHLGNNIISARVDGIPLSTTRIINVAYPSAPSLAVSTLSTILETISTDESTQIILQLKDEFGNNRSTDDGTVTFATTLGGFSGNNGPVSVTAVYSGNGTYSAVLFASYSSINHGVGIAQISGTIDFEDELYADGDFAEKPNVTITEGLPDLTTSTITADPTEITTDEYATLIVQLKDHLGNLILNNRGEVEMETDVLGEITTTEYDVDGKYVAYLWGDVRPINGTGVATITGQFSGSGITGTFNNGLEPVSPTTAQVTITEGLPSVNKILIASNPSTITTDESSQITVTLFDHLGNLITSSRGTVALFTDLGAISNVTDNMNGTYTATLTGNATGTGTATITGTIAIDDLGNPIPMIDQTTVEISEGLPTLTNSVISAEPVSMTTDGSSTITVQLKDQWGNSLTTSRGTVNMVSTIGLLSEVTDNDNGTYSAILTGDTRGLNGTGISTITASFDGDESAPTVSGDFTNSTQVEITEGLPAVAQIEIYADPTSMTTDESSTITVQLRDQFGNLIVNDRGLVVLSTSLGAIGVTNYTSSGQYEATLTANSTGTGTATISGTIQIDSEGPALVISDNTEVLITEGLPSLAESTIYASPVTITTDGESTITLQLKDQWGNLLTTSRGVVSMESTIGQISSVTDNNDGTYTAKLTGDTRGVNGIGNSIITASFAGSGSAAEVIGDFIENTNVQINEGLPSVLTTLLSANPETMTIDQTSLISVQLKDQFGNLILNDRALVELITDRGILSDVVYTEDGVYTATLSGNNQGIGLATINGTIKPDGLGDALNIDDDTTVEITEGVPAIATTTISANPESMTIDQTSLISVQLIDQFGNNIVNNRANVTLDTDRGILSDVIYAGEGIYTTILSGNSDGVGLATITGTIQIDGEGDILHIADDATVNITEGLPNLLTSVITAESATITTDGSTVITVQLKDQFGNNIVNNRGTVIISTSLGAITATNYSEAGKYEATLSGNQTGTGLATLSATLDIDNGGTAVAIGDTESVTIIEGLPALSQIEITAVPDAITADETSTITVQLKDQWGNLLTTSRGTVSLATSPIGVVSAVTNNSDGTYTATFSLNAYGTGEATITGTLTGEVSGNITDDASVMVTHGVANKLAILTQPSSDAMAGVPFTTQPKINIEDQFGNLVDSDNETQVTATRGTTGSAEIFGTLTVTAVDGIASFVDLEYRKMETMNIEFTSEPVLSSVTSGSVVVDHAQTAYYTLNDREFIIAGGARAPYTVTRYDEYGNLVNKVIGAPAGTPETVFLYSNLPGTFHTALTGGSVISSVNIASGNTSANFWFYSTTASNHTITVSDNNISPDGDLGIDDASDIIVVRPAALSHFLVYGVGSEPDENGFTYHYYGDRQSVTVEAIDLYGNRKTNYTDRVTFSLTDDLTTRPNNFPVDYTFQVSDNGIKTFTDAILFSRPSSYHPSNEWWITVVDHNQPSKYGAQVKIKVLPRPLYVAITETPTKIYDGNTDITLTASFEVSNVVSGQSIAAFKASANFDTKDVGSGKEITAVMNSNGGTTTDYVAGANTNLNYYSLPAVVSGTGSITQRELLVSITGIPTKTYDGNTEAYLVSDDYTVITGVEGETFTVTNQTNAWYDEKNQGERMVYVDFPISANYYNKNNWTAAASRGTTSISYETVAGQNRLRLAYNGNGTPRNGTYTFTITANKTETVSFDWYITGCHSWWLSAASYSIWVGNTSNIVQVLHNAGGCSFTNSGSSNFNVDAGQQWGIIISGSHNDSANLLNGRFEIVMPSFEPGMNTLASNYIFPLTAEGPGYINRKDVTGSFVAENKDYDGNTDANIISRSISGVVAADANKVALIGGTAAFASKDMGTHTVTSSGMTIGAGSGGDESDNYSLTGVETTTATINAKSLTITAPVIAERVYDGTTDPGELTIGTLSGFIDNETVTATGMAASYSGKDAGEYTVSVTYTLHDGDNGGLADNYSLASGEASGMVTQRPLTASSVVNSKVYDGLTSTGTLELGDVTNLVGDETLVISISSTDFADKHVGAGKATTITYTLEDGNDSNGGLAMNYIMEPIDVTGEITVRAINVTAQATSKIYDGDTSSETEPLVDDLQTGDVVTFAGMQTYDTKNMGTEKTLTPSGTVIDDGNNGDNYEITYVSQNVGEITARELQVVVVNNPTKVYDGNTTATLTASNYEITNLVSPETITITQTTGLYDLKDAGNRTITVSLTSNDYSPSNGGVLTNYVLPASVTGGGAITTRTLEFSNFVADNKMYDGTTSVTGDGFNDDRVTDDVLAFTYDVAFTDKHAATGKTVNFTNIAISGGTDKDNYTLVANSGTATANISKRPVNIIVDENQAKVYGEIDPLYYTYSLSSEAGYYGLAEGDSFDGEVDNRYAGENVGTYDVNRGSLAIIDSESENMEDNYDVTFTSAEFAITPLEVTVLVDAKNKTYGNVDPELTFVSVPANGSELDNGEVIEFSGMLSRIAGEDVGTYAIEQNSLTNANYAVTFQSALLTINKRPITLTANDRTKTYGEILDIGSTEFTVGGDGMASGEIVDGVTLSSSGTVQKAKVGNYDILIGGAASTTANLNLNYSITYQIGTLTIEKRPLTLYNFGADSKYYDGTTTATGMGFHDDRLTGDNLAFGRTAEFEDAWVGNLKKVYYTYIAITGGLDKDNYVLKPLTEDDYALANIWPKEITVSAVGIDKVYDGNTDATVNLSGNFLVGDDVSLSYSNAEFTNPNTGIDIPVTVTGISLTGEKAGQYSVNSTSANTTADISARTLTVKADDITIPYTGNLFTGFTSTITGFVNSETVAVVSGNVTFTGEANNAIMMGEYPIVPVIDGLSASNYTFTASAGTLTITSSPAQTIELVQGWNVISSYLVPENGNMSDIFNNHIQTASLVKVMDETGKSVENLGSFGGWKNSIGNWLDTEGYKVYVNTATTLFISGNPVIIPKSIPVYEGWNIISWPIQNEADALSVFQGMIAEGKLIKVMDEMGNSLEYFGGEIGWANNIGNLKPGKGYLVRASVNGSLDIDEQNQPSTKSAIISANSVASSWFRPVYKGNGTDHMNINVVNLSNSGLRDGDEIGIFDGKVVVGSAMISTMNLYQGYISIPVSANDGMTGIVNGFTPGNMVSIKIYRDGKESELGFNILNNSPSTFIKGGSMFITAKADFTTHVNIREKAAMKYYPNPFTSQLTIEVDADPGESLEVVIFDATGRIVRRLFNGQAAGHTLINWDAKNDNGQSVVPGMYYLRLNGEISKAIIKM